MTQEFKNRPSQYLPFIAYDQTRLLGVQILHMKNFNGKQMKIEDDRVRVVTAHLPTKHSSSW